MGIGERIQAWLRGLPIVGMLYDWFIAQNERRAKNQAIVWARFQKAWEARDYGQAAVLLLTYLAFVITNAFPISTLEFFVTPTGQEAEAIKFAADPRAYILEQIKKAMSDPSVQSWVDFTGALVTTPVLTLLEDFAGKGEIDPHEFSKRFHGIASGLPWAAQSVDSALNAVMGDRAPKLGNTIQSLYWGLGLGFLGWQTLAPLLSSGLQPPLNRYYLKLYRPERFTPQQIQDLYSLGLLSETTLKETLREQGWRDEDIGNWLTLSYRKLSEGDCWKLYHDGHITDDEMDRRLRAFGYDPAELANLYLANPREDEQDIPKYLSSTLQDAFLNDRITEDELRVILAQQEYAAREIDLRLAQLKAKKVTDARDLTTGQIKELYGARVIGRDEAITNLRDLEYTDVVASNLVKAWDLAAAPKAARLNKSTIMEGYTSGALTRGEALNLLQSESGYDSTKAELIVKIEEAGITQRARIAAQPRPASLSELADFVKYGLITRADLEQRGEIKRLAAADRPRMVELMYLQLQTQVAALPLTQSQISAAYVLGVITRVDLLGRLEGMNMSAADAELLVLTIEADNPEVFGEVAVTLKEPSVGALQLALQRGILDETAFRQKLGGLGYTDDGIEIQLLNAQYQAPVNPRELTKSEVISLYRDEIIGRAEARRRLQVINYTITDVELILTQQRLFVEDTEAAQWFLSGVLSLEGASQVWTDEGFTPDDIADFLARVVAGEFGLVG
jgi:hypothetical protein